MISIRKFKPEFSICAKFEYNHNNIFLKSDSPQGEKSCDYITAKHLKANWQFNGHLAPTSIVQESIATESESTER